jgi:hypothetical protein
LVAQTATVTTPTIGVPAVVVTVAVATLVPIGQHPAIAAVSAEAVVVVAAPVYDIG